VLFDGLVVLLRPDLAPTTFAEMTRPRDGVPVPIGKEFIPWD